MSQNILTTEIYSVIPEVQISFNPEPDPRWMPKIEKSCEAYGLLLKSWDPASLGLVMEAKALFMNQKGRLLGIRHLSTGGLNETTVDPKIIYPIALNSTGCRFIVALSHPSGETEPSKSEKERAAELKAGAKLLSLQMLDFMIITKDRYLSFADEGLL